MCLGIPAQVIELLDTPDLVVAEVFGARRQVNVGLIDAGVEPGDWVLLHVGFAIEKLGPDELERVQASLHLVGGGGTGGAGDEGDDPLAALEAELAERSMRREGQEPEPEEVGQWA